MVEPAPETIDGDEQETGHTQIGGRQAPVGQDIGVEHVEAQGQEASQRPVELPGPLEDEAAQQDGQHHDGQTGQQDNLIGVLVGVPEKLGGKGNGVGTLPVGTVGGQFEIGQE
jgi:hypothetical protein